MSEACLSAAGLFMSRQHRFQILEQPQVCLQKNNYQEEKCQKVLQSLVDCCALWKEQSWKVCQGIDYPGKKDQAVKTEKL